ncbi:phosphate:Na+ symporter [Bacilli bacterium PM5-3]|nr:phosphate:Na+ symporter [Bacilli bacterium PM5-3]MDH6603474.1 phosphate:Na+ symporter [Bacilli bacterium PM5-9]
MQEFISQAQAVNFDGLIVLAGLGLFLFGIKTMGDQLKLLAGSKMKTLIDKYTTNPIMGVFVGAMVTGLIQSSSGTTALTISLVRSGLMNLKQAVGIIMGANIGTTITAILIGFNLSKFAPYFIVIGAFAYMFSKKPRQEQISMLLLSFGCLFFGLSIMGDGLKVLADMPLFKDFAVELSQNKIAGVSLGIGMTVLIQSSSATIGILQSLYSDGLLDLQGTLPILFGNNIGTTITAILAAVGGSLAARRAAAAHVMFNIFGTIIFLIIFPLFLNFVVWGSDVLGLSKLMQIAFAHASFNVTTTILLFPFIGGLVYLATKIVRDKGDEDDIISTTITLDPALIKESPEVAVSVAYKATLEMSTICEKMIRNTRKFITTKDYKYVDKINGNEEIVNELNHKISSYLVEIGSYAISERDNILHNNLFYSLKDLERVGDQCINVVDYFEDIYNANEELTPMALDDLLLIFDLLDSLMANVTKLLDSPSKEIINEVNEKEDELDELEVKAKSAYIERVKNKERMGSIATSVFIDIISDLERIGDHCYNISTRANKVLERKS